MKNEQHAVKILHALGDNKHTIAMSALRVMLLEDTNGWFAQALEIDYSASGESIEEVKKNFEEGFSNTLHEHLRMFGSIDNFLKPADDSAWKEFYHLPKDANCQTYSCFEIHEFEKAISNNAEGIKFPFDQFAFISKNPQEHGVHP